MSITKYSKKDFLAIKKLPDDFRFMVEDWREMETQYGKGLFLSGEVLQDPKALKKHGAKKGLLRISPTTATTFERLGLSEWDQLIQKVIHFEWSELDRTIIAVDVKNWAGDSIATKEEPKTPPKGE